MNSVDNLLNSADSEPMTRKTYTESEVMALLLRRRAGRTQSDFAMDIGVSPQYLSDVLHGRRVIGPTILKYLGLEVGFVESTRAA